MPNISRSQFYAETRETYWFSLAKYSINVVTSCLLADIRSAFDALSFSSAETWEDSARLASLDLRFPSGWGESSMTIASNENKLKWRWRRRKAPSLHTHWRQANAQVVTFLLLSNGRRKKVVWIMKKKTKNISMWWCFSTTFGSRSITWFTDFTTSKA